MTLSKASQTFNTGAPQYAASEVTAAIEDVTPSGGGMTVSLKFTNEVLNAQGFFPSYTVTATAAGESKQQSVEVFPGDPATLSFEFSSTGPVEVEANPGRNVDSLILNADAPKSPSIQQPTVNAESGPGTATVQYTVSNTGNSDASVDVEITASGSNIETATTTQTKTVPAGGEATGQAAFQFSVDSPADVEICVAIS